MMGFMCLQLGVGESRVTDSPKVPRMPKVYRCLGPNEVGQEVLASDGLRHF